MKKTKVTGLKIWKVKFAKQRIMGHLLIGAKTGDAAITRARGFARKDKFNFPSLAVEKLEYEGYLDA